MERSKKLSQKLLRDRDPGSGGARNPHVLPCTLRFLCSVLTRLTAARDVFEAASKCFMERNGTNVGRHCNRPCSRLKAYLRVE